MLRELRSFQRGESLLRLPPSQDVPITERVRRMLDSAPMRRLASISQLGMVSLVYPGATHTRFEHSLGVYHNALRLLNRFSADQSPEPSAGQSESVDGDLDHRECEAFILAALLHDVGHWPFCHPIEDMQLTDLGEHEGRLANIIANSELEDLIEKDWDCDPEDVVTLLCPPSESKGRSATEAGPGKNAITPGQRFLVSCLSGPIDVDKLDYLQRDSLHSGVPYGENFDANRLISSLCRNPSTGQLAISEKGRTAAEMMVFARYVMFSEVYWHHTVRSATAMLQRSVFLLQHRIDLESTLSHSDHAWIQMLRQAAQGSVAEPLVEGLFGPRRQLFKRIAQYSVLDGEHPIHGALARRPYWWLVTMSERLAERVSAETNIAVHAADLLIDSPPMKLEVDINIDVVGRDGSIRTLGEVSPVASALAHQQFDNHVKRVRVFVRHDLRSALQSRVQPDQWDRWLMKATEEVEQEIV